MKMATRLTCYFLFTVYLIVRCCGVDKLICDDSHVCPSHKQFCTEVGCVYECPKNFYVNGTSCVLSCGDWFVTPQRQCQSTCPDNFFIRENVRRFDSSVYLEKQCVSSCNEQEFHFNGTCVRGCPSNFSYVYNYTCVTECPPNQYVRETVSDIYGKLYLQKLCLTVCDESEFFFNGTCVKQCPENLRYITNNSCASECPENARFINNFTVNGIMHFECVETCQYLEEDGYCVSTCSREYFMYDTTCVSNCPDTKPISQSKTCVQECRVGYAVNKTCHLECPVGFPNIYNRTCLAQCPDEAAFVDPSNNKSFCTDTCLLGYYSYKYYGNMSCLHDCPEYTLRYDRYPMNKSCVTECPFDAPNKCDTSCFAEEYGQLTSTGICLSSCPITFPFKMKYHCQKSCPGVSLNKTCLSVCPKLFPYLTNVTECLGPCNPSSLHWFLECRSTCDKYQLRINDTIFCVDICPENTVVFNFTCWESCPLEYPLTAYFAVSYNIFYLYTSWGAYLIRNQETNELRLHCVENCGNKTMKFGLKCVESCPRDIEGRATFYFNGSCLDSCPDKYPYIGNITTNETCSLRYEWITLVEYCTNMNWYYACFSSCPENTFVSGNYCETHCSHSLMAYKRTCVSKCPTSTYFQRYKEVLSVWEPYYYMYSAGQDKYFQLRQTPEDAYRCVSSCNSVIDLRSCVENCPFQRKYIVQGKCQESECLDLYRRNTSYGIECFETCPDNTVLHENMCIDSCPSEARFIRNGQCTPYCPDNYVLSHSPFGINCWYRCQNNLVLGENRTCVEKCPADIKYIFDGICVNQCPDSKPFGTKKVKLFDEKNSFRCISKCEDDYVFKADEEECISRYSCNSPYFVFADQCLTECPGGYHWFADSCFHRLSVILSAVFEGLLCFVCVFCVRKSFTDTLYFLDACRRSEEVEEQVRLAYQQLLLTEDVGPVQEPPVDVDMVDIAECYLLQPLENNAYDNLSLSV